MIDRVRARQEWQFFRTLRRAAPAYAISWWILIVLRGTLPAVTSVAFGWLVSAITRDVSLVGPLVMVGASFALLLISQPLHQVVSANLGARMAAHLYHRLLSTCVAPPGIAHLERAELTTDLTMARDFDLGMMGPPLEISMDFIAGGLVDLVVGISAAILLANYHWWASLLLVVAWLATPLAAPRERRMEGPQHRRGAPRPAARRVLVPPGRRRRLREGAAVLRARRAG